MGLFSKVAEALAKEEGEKDEGKYGNDLQIVAGDVEQLNMDDDDHPFEFNKDGEIDFDGGYKSYMYSNEEEAETRKLHYTEDMKKAIAIGSPFKKEEMRIATKGEMTILNLLLADQGKKPIARAILDEAASNILERQREAVRTRKADKDGYSYEAPPVPMAGDVCFVRAVLKEADDGEVLPIDGCPLEIKSVSGYHNGDGQGFMGVVQIERRMVPFSPGPDYRQSLVVSNQSTNLAVVFLDGPNRQGTLVKLDVKVRGMFFAGNAADSKSRLVFGFGMSPVSEMRSIKREGYEIIGEYWFMDICECYRCMQIETEFQSAFEENGPRDALSSREKVEVDISLRFSKGFSIKGEIYAVWEKNDKDGGDWAYGAHGFTRLENTVRKVYDFCRVGEDLRALTFLAEHGVPTSPMMINDEFVVRVIFGVYDENREIEDHGIDLSYFLRSVSGTQSVRPSHTDGLHSAIVLNVPPEFAPTYSKMCSFAQYYGGKMRAVISGHVVTQLSSGTTVVQRLMIPSWIHVLDENSFEGRIRIPERKIIERLNATVRGIRARNPDSYVPYCINAIYERISEDDCPTLWETPVNIKFIHQTLRDQMKSENFENLYDEAIWAHMLESFDVDVRNELRNNRANSDLGELHGNISKMLENFWSNRDCLPNGKEIAKLLSDSSMESIKKYQSILTCLLNLIGCFTDNSMQDLLNYGFDFKNRALSTGTYTKTEHFNRIVIIASEDEQDFDFEVVSNATLKRRGVPSQHYQTSGYHLLITLGKKAMKAHLRAIFLKVPQSRIFQGVLSEEREDFAVSGNGRVGRHYGLNLRCHVFSLFPAGFKTMADNLLSFPNWCSLLVGLGLIKDMRTEVPFADLVASFAAYWSSVEDYPFKDLETIMHQCYPGDAYKWPSYRVFGSGKECQTVSRYVRVFLELARVTSSIISKKIEIDVVRRAIYETMQRRNPQPPVKFASILMGGDQILRDLDIQKKLGLSSRTEAAKISGSAARVMEESSDGGLTAGQGGNRPNLPTWMRPKF